MRKIAVLALAGLLSTAGFAQWVEVGDAGQLVGTAQATGAGALSTISGSVAGSDVDMYAIQITNPAAFSASVSGTGDSQLFLFNGAGRGVVHNDDSAGVLSAFGGSLVPSAGTYYIAITGYNRDATSAGGLIWNNTPFTGERAPDGPGAASPLTGWTGTHGFTSYTLNLTGAAGIPEPTSLALLALGALGLIRRR